MLACSSDARPGMFAAAVFTKNGHPFRAAWFRQVSPRHLYPRAALYPVQDQLQSANPVRSQAWHGIRTLEATLA